MPKALRILLVSLISGFLVFSYIFYSESGVLPNYRENFENLLFVLIVTSLLGFLLNLISKWLSKIIPWGKNTIFRFSAGFLLHFFVVAVVGFSIVGLFISMQENESGFFEVFTKYRDPALKILFLSLIFVFIYSIIDFTLFSYNQYAEGQIAGVKNKKDQLKLQYQVFKSQLSPHFLFNNMNTISSLVDRDYKLAEKYIRMLANNYEYILSTEEKKLIKISEEVEFLKDYCFMLSIRFENSLKMEIDIPEAQLNCYIPPLSLQMLLENSVKHNALSEETPLLVTIRKKNKDYIEISNNLIDRAYNLDSIGKYAGKSTKVGLDNIRERYKYFTNNKMIIEKDEFFRVQIPVIQKKRNRK
ncbi:sensor histidine kinase [Bacteroidota bacterium]